MADRLTGKEREEMRGRWECDRYDTIGLLQARLHAEAVAACTTGECSDEHADLAVRLTELEQARADIPRLLDELDRVEGEVGRLEKRDAIARKAMQAVAGLQVCADIGALAETARWRKTARRMAGEARAIRAQAEKDDAWWAEHCDGVGAEYEDETASLEDQRDTARTALAQRDGRKRKGEVLAKAQAFVVEGLEGER